MLSSLTTASEIGRLVNNKTIKAVEVIDYYKKRIEKDNSILNAFTYTKFDEAYERANEIDKAIERGEHIGVFAGVPFGLKDFLPSKKGWLNTHGGVKSLMMEDSESSEFCKAMENLGGIAIGKTNAPSFGFSGLTYNKMYGITKNPFDHERNSGGSSGGSASAVGGDLITISEGGDGGGSIRIPSSWCNCVGYKPSVGRIPSVCRPDAWTATHPYCFNGGICKSVEDAAILFCEMNKYNPRDPLSVPVSNTPYKNIEIPKITIGYTYDWNCFNIVDKEIEKAFTETIEELKSLGIRLIPVYPKVSLKAEDIANAWCLSISIDTAYDLEVWKREGLDLYKKQNELPKGFLEWQERAFNINIHHYKDFHHIRTELLDMHEDLFNKDDFIISPVTTILPPKNSEIEKFNQIDFGMTPMQNFTGHPSCSLPGQFSSEGLPIGLQIVGRKYDDENMFKLMSFIEKSREKI